MQQEDQPNEVIELTNQDKSKDEKKVSFEIGYIIPFWSSKPLYKYTLDIWRDGVISQSIDISNKEYYIFGRNKDIVDIYIGNVTVSRVHCVLQHKDDGEVFLYDLESVYGTSINKRPLTKKSYVNLKVGDTFKLGKSGKMFILNGPADLMPDEDEKPIRITDKKTIMEKRIKQVTEIYNKSEEHKRNLLGLNNESANWGQRDFDEEIRTHEKQELKEDEDEKEGLENEYLGPLHLDKLKLRKDLSEKQRKMINKMENLLTGINRLKEENIKIKKKELDRGEITEGQAKRIDMNEKKLSELYEKFELHEDNLRISLSSKDGLNQTELKFDKKAFKELNSDDDEFFDRAKNTENKKNDKQEAPIVGNYETLKKNLEEMVRSRQKLADKLQKVDQDILNDKNEKIDSLDLYMNDNISNLVALQKEKLAADISNLSKEISKTQKLISFVTPSFIKIKFKSEAEEDQNRLKQLANRKQNSNPDINIDDNGEDVSHYHNVNSLARDSEAIKSNEGANKKKKNEPSLIDYLAKFDKMQKKYQSNAFKKFTDSDEEVLVDAESFKNKIDEEIEDELKEKRKIAIKEIEKLIQLKEKMGQEKEKKVENEENEIKNYEKGGLVIKKKKEEKVETSNNYFGEIINNINQDDFDINKYTQFNEIVTKKQDEKNKNKIDKMINYGIGGLQTFEKNLLQTDKQLNTEQELLSGRKRDRNEELNEKQEVRKVYGATPKPQSRHQEKEDIDEEDYDSKFLPQEQFSKAEDLTVEKYSKRNLDD